MQDAHLEGAHLGGGGGGAAGGGGGGGRGGGGGGGGSSSAYAMRSRAAALPARTPRVRVSRLLTSC